MAPSPTGRTRTRPTRKTRRRKHFKKRQLVQHSKINQEEASRSLPSNSSTPSCNDFSKIGDIDFDQGVHHEVPSSGCSTPKAQRFNQGFMSHISGGRGTLMRPVTVDAYLFSLIDEDAKSIDPGNFERHWGVFTYYGVPKYPLNLGTTNSGSLVPARNVDFLDRKWCVMKPSAKLDDPQVQPSVSYACGRADCTSLGYGTSCGNLDARGNISYAFNSYYQRNNQLDTACKFPNLSMITKTDPTVGDCRFGIMIEPYYGGAERTLGCLQMPLTNSKTHAHA
ncbi:glucan endo-1,3-beta-glucosidase 6-like [Carya illinoinensis]|uniref:glucan endo-1,3-beta-glucosidase 6-like n=1 Tax=Carya illinoinensis TaxID=32201 RepID=UPI001C726590|nr:glucan endo-1,3-beta-glucosidase 6-like [Carya illinoinensis]